MSCGEGVVKIEIVCYLEGDEEDEDEVDDKGCGNVDNGYDLLDYLVILGCE